MPCPDNVLQYFCLLTSNKGMAEHHHFKKRAPKRPHVDLSTILLSHMNFWRKIQRAAALRVLHDAHGIAYQLGQSHVTKLAHAPMQENIRRLARRAR